LDRAGSTDKTLKFYVRSFHDPLNDIDKENVMKDVTGRVNARIPALLSTPTLAQAAAL